jgi:ubiquinone/menaquinone biosynthesis C-methylase UbiE
MSISLWTKRILKSLINPILTCKRILHFIRTLNIKSSKDYWTKHNVTKHLTFSSREESLNSFKWRSLQYDGYLELMPVDKADGLVVLDFGCGPGHDLVGFSEFSKPKRLIGADVSSTSLAETQHRMQFHPTPCELLLLNEESCTIPLENESVDLIHCSGVLHHTPDPVSILREFKRIIRPGGKIQIMIYNYDSIWMHLLAYFRNHILRHSNSIVDKRSLFSKTTDGPNCPISKCYKPDEWIKICTSCGFDTTFV